MTRLRFLVSAVDAGDWGTEPMGNNDVAVVRAADFDRRHLVVESHRLPLRSVSAEKRTSLALRRGDLVLEKSGGGEEAPVGLAVLFDHDFAAVASNFAARIRPTELVSPPYLRYVFAAIYFLGFNQRSINQTTGIQNLDVNALLAEPWCIPPRAEQDDIVASLDASLAGSDRLETLVAEQLPRVAQYRRALITEAMTGRLTSSAGDTMPAGSASAAVPL